MLRKRLMPVMLVLCLLFSAIGGGTGLAAGLTVTPDTLQITAPVGGTGIQSLTVQGATGALTATADAAWVTVLVDGAQVNVAATATGRSAGDADVASVTIRDSAGAQVVVPVVFTVAGGGSGGTALTVSPTAIDLGTVAPGSTRSTSFKVTATAAGSISGTITSLQPWIVVAPKTLSAASQAVTVVVRTEGLAAGETHTGSIKIDAGPAGVLEVPVSVSVAAPAAPKEAVGASPFNDVPSGHWALNAIQYMQKQKVINGFADGSYRPDQLVTREQFAKIMVAALQLPLISRPAVPSFPDVPAEWWSNAYVETARPYLTGFADGLFRPADPAMREDIAAALVLAKGLHREAPPDPSELDLLFTDGAQIQPPALKLLIARAVKAKLISGYEDHTFRPRESLTRAEAAVLLYRAVSVASPVPKTAPPGATVPGLVGAQPSAGMTAGVPVVPAVPLAPVPAAPVAAVPAPGTGTTGDVGAVVAPAPAAPVAGGGGYGLGAAPAAWPEAASIKVFTLGGGIAEGKADGPINKATFSSMKRVTIGPNGAVYVSMNTGNSAFIRKIVGGQVSTVWTIQNVASGWQQLLVTDKDMYYSFNRGDASEAMIRRAHQDDESDKQLLGRYPYMLRTASGTLYLNDRYDMWKVLGEDARQWEVISDSSTTGTDGKLVAVDEAGGRMMFFEGGAVKEMRLFPRNISTIVTPSQSLGFGQTNNRGGLYAYYNGTVYRWAPGQTDWKKLFSLDQLSYEDSSPVTKDNLVDMAVDAKGNIVLLDKGNNSIRYVQIFN